MQYEKYDTPLGEFKEAIWWCYGKVNHAVSTSMNTAEECPIVDLYTNMTYCKPSDANACLIW